MPEFKDMLKYFRMKTHLSQSELAEKIGVSASTISMYEVGKREPDFETEEKIADFFNTDLNTLRGRDTESNDHYYLNEETAQLAQKMFEDEDMRSLFDMKRNMPPERFKAHMEFMKNLYNQEKGNDV